MNLSESLNILKEFFSPTISQLEQGCIFNLDYLLFVRALAGLRIFLE